MICLMRGCGLLLSFCLLVGCADMGRKHRNASSVVDYLYPNKEVREVPSVPQLSLPLKVGVAFVPETSTSYWNKSNLSEKDKLDLMERISEEFRKLEFVDEIELIPSAYLTQSGGFANLDQIKTMYGIDVIALLSYDQIQHTDQGLLSLSYWTLVGAYVVKGEKNDTNTMVDAAVYDISSRKMLFRAPGKSHIKNSSTLVNLSEKLRADSLAGFRLASDDLVFNLQAALDRFKVKIKEKPEQVVVKHRAGYTGSSSLGSLFALLALGLVGVALWRDRRA